MTEDCFGNKFIVRRNLLSAVDHEWAVLAEDPEAPDQGFVRYLDIVDDCDTEDEAIAAWQRQCEQNKEADKHSPFYGLTDEEIQRICELMERVTVSGIKGKALPSRKSNHVDE